MTLQQFHTCKEQQFDAFCKAVIRNESADLHRALSRKLAREVSVENTAFAKLPLLQTLDDYHPDTTWFWVKGKRIAVSDWFLGQALRLLPPYRRDVILLSYFRECSDAQIGRFLQTNVRTVRSRRISALARLKKLLEEFADEAR